MLTAAAVRESARGEPFPVIIQVDAAQSSGELKPIWRYHDDDLPGPDAVVELTVNGLPVKNGDVQSVHYRIDARHSNAYAEWQRMESPAAPDREQYDRLIQAGELARLENAPAQVPVRAGSATLKFQLPRQAVSLVVLELN